MEPHSISRVVKKGLNHIVFGAYESILFLGKEGKGNRPMIGSLTLQELFKFFESTGDSGVLVEAKQAEVKDLELKEDYATAQVLDKDSNCYLGKVYWKNASDSQAKNIRSECECASGVNCIHGIAILFALLKEVSRTAASEKLTFKRGSKREDNSIESSSFTLPEPVYEEPEIEQKPLEMPKKVAFAVLKFENIIVRKKRRSMFVKLGYKNEDEVEVIELLFRYGHAELNPKSRSESVQILHEGKYIDYPREKDFEDRVINKLKRLGLIEVDIAGKMRTSTFYVPARAYSSRFRKHIQELSQALAMNRIHLYDHRTNFSSFSGPEEKDMEEVLETKTVSVDEISAEVEDQGQFWFRMDLGILVEGKRYSLLPILFKALSILHGDYSDASLKRLNVEGKFVAQLEDGTQITMPFERIKSIVRSLVDVFGNSALKTEGHIDLTPVHFKTLKSRGIENHISLDGARRLRSGAVKLEKFASIEPIGTPPGLKTKLRPYQKYGVAWLQELSRQRLGGILADDMGLGKTIQTLAHLLLAKKAKKLTNPALVICPKSVVDVWMGEASVYAPGLKVINLTGNSRHKRYSQIEKADLIVTTYNLVSRDLEYLEDRRYFAVIVDEAQNIKNHQTIAARTISKLQAGHRICLTGTTVENHLGELWSHFNFLIPGLLGKQQSFKSAFISKDESERNEGGVDALKQRIKPFVLRRLKEDVEQDLPPKTTIIKRVYLDTKQRDLYEAVRLSVNKAVQEKILNEGLAKSQIHVLSALTKLRQVCCDPRLLPRGYSGGVRKSAKLQVLLDMVNELVQEGRRIIVFSQFASMLDLISVALRKQKVDFVELTGSTRDRKTPVDKFQSGDVPVFLISLKAGGSGLTLTAADTVIHYDPWWNPQVENQATDRAYRIGQDKPVFVYKLIAQGTVEEKILEMQESKRVLAQNMLDFDATTSTNAISQEDLDSLFAPINQ